MCAVYKSPLYIYFYKDKNIFLPQLKDLHTLHAQMLSMASVVPFYGVKVVLSEVDVAGGKIVTAEEASMG